MNKYLNMLNAAYYEGSISLNSVTCEDNSERLKMVGIHEIEDEDICLHYIEARKQRKAEKNTVGNLGTLSYEKWGCYECFGFNKECPVRETLSDLEKE